MIRMLVLDLDGTLLEPSGLIHPYTSKLLNEVAERGVMVTIATGRPFSRTLVPLRVNELYPGSPFPQFLICEERDIYELRDGEFAPWPENEEARAREIELLPLSHYLLTRLASEIPTLEYAVNNTYSQRTRGFLELYFVERSEAEEAFRFLVHLTKDTPLKAVRNGRNVCLRANFSGKAEALQRLVEKEGIEFSNILAVGDSNNDLDMLTCGVRGATTANADQEVKQAINQLPGYISQANHSLGVGQIIEDCILPALSM